MIRGWAHALVVITVWVALRMVVWLAAASPSLASVGPWGILVLDLAMAGIFVRTASRFSAGDPPRLAWGLAGVTQMLATTAHVLDQSAWMTSVGIEDGIVVVLNGTWIACVLVFVRNIRQSGLVPRWSVAQAVVVGVVDLLAVLVALWIIGDLLAEPIPAQATWVSTWGPLVSNLASTIGDAVVFTSAVFLIRLVLPMAGGALARVYLLFAVSSGAYLLLDALLAAAGESMYSGLDAAAQIIVAVAGGGLIAAAMAQVDLLDR